MPLRVSHANAHYDVMVSRQTAGAFRIGLLHGGYCVGCYWLLFAILFPLGMSIGAMTVVTLIILAEKTLPRPALVSSRYRCRACALWRASDRGHPNSFQLSIRRHRGYAVGNAGDCSFKRRIVLKSAMQKRIIRTALFLSTMAICLAVVWYLTFDAQWMLARVVPN